MVAVLYLELAIFEAQSLKDKRRVIQSVKRKVRDRFNVSVAETDYQDTPKRCRLGIAMIACEARAMHSQLDKIVDLVRRVRGLSLLDYRRELL